ncbi:unnamed protein product [Rotaria sordida]|uniref:Uncharacterized protein n=1 Tax=Rotaria sordida TaxID=392033 RepID=A0A814X537_9BILA|nr:unnamed protein product [Rotaria sordida]CAF1491169.1 unnamed protein product [Rotaria sordida]
MTTDPILATTTATAMTSTTTVTSPPLATTSEAPIIPTSSTQQSGTGLGRAATAGLACGIIFSVLIFTGEIIFFKFFYSESTSNGHDRSVAYRT